MIYLVDNHYVISSHHVWIPGVYVDKRTAQYAFQFSDTELQLIQDTLKPNGVITKEHLKNFRKGGLIEPEKKVS